MGMLKSSSSSTNPKITDCTPSPFLVDPLRPHDGGMGTPAAASRHALPSQCHESGMVIFIGLTALTG